MIFFSVRIKHLEKHIINGFYNIFVELIAHETRLCAIERIGLRSSKYDRKPKSGKGTRLGYFNIYKLSINKGRIVISYVI